MRKFNLFGGEQARRFRGEGHPKQCSAVLFETAGINIARKPEKQGIGARYAGELRRKLKVQVEKNYSKINIARNSFIFIFRSM